MMTDKNLIFLLGIAAGIGITLAIEAVILLLVYVLIKEDDDR